MLHVLLPLANKKVALDLWQCRIQLGRKTKMNSGRKETESARHRVVAEGERYPRALTVKYKII